jgi:S-layer protein
MAITAAEQTNVVKLVVGMFNAAPGSIYLAAIDSVFEANGHNFSALSETLSGTAAFQTMYPPDLPAEQFAAAFLGTLGLQDNLDAIAFVVAKSNAGVNRGQIILDGLVALLNSTSPAFADAKLMLNNKTEVALYYSVTKSIAQTDVAILQRVISGVTSDPGTIGAAEAAIDGIDSGPGPGSQTFTLTPGVDTIVGTSGDDVINGTDLTFTASDNINGAAGTDTLNVMDAAGNLDLSLAAVTAVEAANLTSAGVFVNADVSGWTGLASAVLDVRGAQAMMAAATTDVIMSDVAVGGGAVSVEGGNDITVTAAGMTDGSVIKVGSVVAPTGGVRVVVNDVADDRQIVIGGFNFTGVSNGVNVTGGTSVEITQNLVAAPSGVPEFFNSLTNGIVVNGTSNTTTVSIRQNNLAGVFAPAGGKVSITDASFGTAAAGTISNVTLDGRYFSAEVRSNALTSLALANYVQEDISVFNSAAAALALSLDDTFLTFLNLDAGGATYTSLSVTTNTDATLALTAAAVKTLNVAGTGQLTASGLGAAETVVVSGAAGLVFSGPALKSIDASATSGDNRIAIDGTQASYVGGSGVDTLTVNAGIGQPISLRDGDDTLIFAGAPDVIPADYFLNGIPPGTAPVSGGSGIDTLRMNGDDADDASHSTVFSSVVTGFEKLLIDFFPVPTAAVIDLAGLGNFSFVTMVSPASVTLDNMPSGGTVEIIQGHFAGGTSGPTSSEIVHVTGAASGTADALNVVLRDTQNLHSTISAPNVETINVLSTGSIGTVVPSHSLTLPELQATQLTITGDANLLLDTGGNGNIVSIDASAMSGALTYADTGGVVTTIAGGSGNDLLSALASEIILGGAGNDTLVAGFGSSTFTGGPGADLFVVPRAGGTGQFTTITDASGGDTLRLADKGTETFNAVRLSLADGASLQDYLNAAASGNGSTNAIISWFQFGGDTYVVEDLSADAGFVSADTGDIALKLVGLVDLSVASFSNADAPTLLIA